MVNIRPKLPAGIDPDLRELDLSKSGVIEPEEVDDGCENAPAALEIDDGKLVGNLNDMIKLDASGGDGASLLDGKPGSLLGGN